MYVYVRMYGVVGRSHKNLTFCHNETIVITTYYSSLFCECTVNVYNAYVTESAKISLICM